MITRIILTTLLLTTAHGLSAQNDESPENRRYLNPVFDEVIFTENIVYATKRNDLNNKKEELKLRVFEPKDDSLAARPLFLLTPGGAFMVTGDDWMNDVAEELAKAGFVVALNKYRLSSSIDTPEKYAVALRKAMTDQTDALRFLINDARGKNRFRIDPDKIFIGGHSAGAILLVFGVNNLGRYGRWAFAEFTARWTIQSEFAARIEAWIDEVAAQERVGVPA